MVNYGTGNETFPSEYTISNRQNINQQQLPLASAKAEDDKKSKLKIKRGNPIIYFILMRFFNGCYFCW